MAKMKYKMSSRATILLGRESVSRVDGAIIELVKNTYDADAGFCCLCFDVEHDQIYILDMIICFILAHGVTDPSGTDGQVMILK